MIIILFCSYYFISYRRSSIKYFLKMLSFSSGLTSFIISQYLVNWGTTIEFSTTFKKNNLLPSIYFIYTNYIKTLRSTWFILINFNFNMYVQAAEFQNFRARVERSPQFMPLQFIYIAFETGLQYPTWCFIRGNIS